MIISKKDIPIKMLNELQAEANNILNQNNHNDKKENILKTLSSHFDNEINTLTSEFKEYNNEFENNKNNNKNEIMIVITIVMLIVIVIVIAIVIVIVMIISVIVMEIVKVVILVKVVNLLLHMIQIQQLLQLIRQKYLEK